MTLEQENVYINRELRKFAVERENLSRAISNDKKTECLELTDTMKRLLINIRSSIREHMIENTKK